MQMQAKQGKQMIFSNIFAIIYIFILFTFDTTKLKYYRLFIDGSLKKIPIYFECYVYGDINKATIFINNKRLLVEFSYVKRILFEKGSILKV